MSENETGENSIRPGLGDPFHKREKPDIKTRFIGDAKVKGEPKKETHYVEFKLTDGRFELFDIPSGYAYSTYHVKPGKRGAQEGNYLEVEFIKKSRHPFEPGIPDLPEPPFDPRGPRYRDQA
jgi:hypothetical protein